MMISLHAPGASNSGASPRRRAGVSFFSTLLALTTLTACSDESPLAPEPVEETTAEAPAGYPLPVTNFSVVSTTTNAVTLRFTQPHDGLGRTADLDIRYMATPIGSRWTQATRVATGSCRYPLSGAAVGSTRTCTVEGLAANTSYDFQMAAFRRGWFSTVLYGDRTAPVTARTASATPTPPQPTEPTQPSQPTEPTQPPQPTEPTQPSEPTQPPVVTAPAAITTLSVISTTSSTATLRFTSVTDGAGSPANVQIGFAPTPISLNGSSAQLVSQGSCAGAVRGSSIGAIVTCTVEGLQSGRSYDFQARAYRGTANAGAIFGGVSNVATGVLSAPTVTPAPVASVLITPGSVSMDTGAGSQLTAVARDASGNPVHGVAVSWSSSNASVAPVSSAGYVNGSSAGQASITATAGGRSASVGVAVLAPAPPSQGDGTVGAIGTAFTREPAGLTRRTHARWAGSTPSGWNLRTDYPGSAVRIVSDASSPTGGALEMFYPAGMQDGLQPGVVWFSGASLNTAQEVFLGVVMKYSNNWITHNNEVKLHLFATNGSWFGIFDGCWNDRVTQWSVGTRGIGGFPVGNGDCWANNRAASPRYTNGQWVRQELYVRKNTAGQADGIVRLWINGQLISEVTNMQFPTNFSFQEFQHAGTWGGGGSPVPQNQSVFIAETYLSSR